MKKQQSILPQEGRGSSYVSYMGKTIDEMVYKFMHKENIPGLAMAIVQAPYIPRVVSYGLSDFQQKKLASTHTLWAIGPISQAYAAVAIMQLYEKGKLQLRDKVSAYLQQLPESWKSVTLLQLLQHATGIPDYRLQNGYSSSKKYSSAELISSVQEIPLSFAPGTHVAQSATNFLLLAEVIETISQITYQDFVTKNQIEFLGLKQTCFAEDFSKLKQENLSELNQKHSAFLKSPDFINPTENATGYDQKLEALPSNHSSALKGFGDIWASAEDISKWDIALAGSILLAQPESRALLYKPTTLDNGAVIPAMAGWQFQYHKGLMDIQGSINGFSSFLSRFTDPSELVCVTLLANREGVNFSNLARLIASAYSKKLASGVNETELYVSESIFSVKETMQRIEDALKTHHVPIFAKFDHSKNAEEVQLQLRPTEVIVFGSPAVGTKLMQENPSIAIDLPLKIVVWEDVKGSVWAGFPQMEALSAKYSAIDLNIVANMQTLLEELVRKATHIY